MESWQGEILQNKIDRINSIQYHFTQNDLTKGNESSIKTDGKKIKKSIHQEINSLKSKKEQLEKALTTILDHLSEQPREIYKGHNVFTYGQLNDDFGKNFIKIRYNKLVDSISGLNKQINKLQPIFKSIDVNATFMLPKDLTEKLNL